jgi:nucleoside-diphosphate kinase
MDETTFVLVKPDCVELVEDILLELDNWGLRLETAKVEKVPREVIENHYTIHRGKPFFRDMVKGFTDKPVVLAVYEGEEVISRFMEIIGPTDPSNAPKWTIRGRYSTDSLEEAISEGRMVRNVIHRSDSPSEVVRELEVWAQYLQFKPQ